LIWLIPHPFSPLSAFLYVAIGLVYRGERGGGGGEVAKPYDSEKAWSSINIKYYLGQDVPAVDGFSETEDQSYNKVETDNQQVKKCIC
jgi:hypothetical protein